MKVKPYFKSTLAKPFNGKHYHEVGSSVVLNTEVHTKSVGDFLVTIPDPVSLNLNNAQNSIDKCSLLKERINKAKEHTVFSKILVDEQQIRGLTIDQIRNLDSDAKFLRKLDNEKVYEYMQASMGAVISLVTAVESFVNMIIPRDYVLKRTGRDGQPEELNREKILRRLSIGDKLDIVANIKSKEGMKQQLFWRDFKQVKDLRDEIIHFKYTDTKIDLLWNPIIITFFDSDLQAFFDSIVGLINFIEPAYLEFE